MREGLDTSVAVRLLVGEPARQAEAAHRWLREVSEPAAISDLVVGETYFALRHHYRVPHGAAVTALRALLGDPRVHPTGVAPDVLPQVGDERGAPGVMDRLIHGDYERSGAVLVTLDRDAARLGNARLLSESAG